MKFRYKATIEGKVNSLISMIQDASVTSYQYNMLRDTFLRFIDENSELTDDEKHWLTRELEPNDYTVICDFAHAKGTTISQASRKIDKIRNKFLKSLLNGCNLEIIVAGNHSIRISKIAKHHDSDRACNTVFIDCDDEDY